MLVCVCVCFEENARASRFHYCKFKLCVEVEKCVNCQNISRYIFETSVRHLNKKKQAETLGELVLVNWGLVRTQKWNDFFCSPYIFSSILKTEIELSCVSVSVCVFVCGVVFGMLWKERLKNVRGQKN